MHTWRRIDLRQLHASQIRPVLGQPNGEHGPLGCVRVLLSARELARVRLGGEFPEESGEANFSLERAKEPSDYMEQMGA